MNETKLKRGLEAREVSCWKRRRRRRRRRQMEDCEEWENEHVLEKERRETNAQAPSPAAPCTPPLALPLLLPVSSLSLSLHLLFTFYFYFYFYFFPKWWWRRRWFQLAFLTKANKLSLKYMYMCMCIYIKGKLPSNLGGCFTLTTYHLFAIPVCFNTPACLLLLTSHAVPLFFFSPYSLYDNDMLPFRFISFIHFCCVSFRTCSLFHPTYAFPFLA